MKKLTLSKTVTERALRALHLERTLNSLNKKLTNINKRITETCPAQKNKEDITILISDYADRSDSRIDLSRSSFDVSNDKKLDKKVYNAWLPAQHAILYMVRSFLENEIEILVEEYNDLETLQVEEE